MVTPTSGSGSSSNSSSSSSQPANSLPSTQPYKGQYAVSPAFRQFWEGLFLTQLSDQDVSQLTDTFVQNIISQMSIVANHALETLQKIEQERQENSQ